MRCITTAAVVVLLALDLFARIAVADDGGGATQQKEVGGGESHRYNSILKTLSIGSNTSSSSSPYDKAMNVSTAFGICSLCLSLMALLLCVFLVCCQCIHVDSMMNSVMVAVITFLTVSGSVLCVLGSYHYDTERIHQKSMIPLFNTTTNSEVVDANNNKQVDYSISLLWAAWILQLSTTVMLLLS